MTETAQYTGNTPTISVGGIERGELARDLQRLDVEEDAHGLRTAVLHLNAVTPSDDATGSDPAYLDGAIVDFGSAITIDFGPQRQTRRIFDGKVSAIELCLRDGELPTVTVYAEDALMALRMTRRSRTYVNSSDEDIARRIADDHGLGADTAASGPTYPVVQQLNQSDLAFLRDRAAHVQAEIWVQDSTLHFATRPNRSAGSVELVYGNQLLAANVRADLAHQRSTVVFGGFDMDAKDRIDEQVGSDPIRAELSSGRIGPDVLSSALGERVSRRTREVPTTGAQAHAWAEAEMLRRGRAFVVLDATTAGTPELTVGTQVTLGRTGTPFAGDGYYTTWVQHSWDPQVGSRTRLRAERATVRS